MTALEVLERAKTQAGASRKGRLINVPEKAQRAEAFADSGLNLLGGLVFFGWHNGPFKIFNRVNLV